jgi:hypothetical protein
VLRDNPAETLFDKGLQGSPLSVGHLAGFFKETVWYLYGRFHTANHIIFDSNLKGLFRNAMMGTGEVRGFRKLGVGVRLPRP